MLRDQRPTIAERIAETGGRTSGFDYLRLCLALGVIISHSSTVSYGLSHDFWDGPQGIWRNLILPMFFALSGFLVCGSLERCRTLITFFGLRALRIVPALAVEVTLSALIFGPLLSSIAPAEYFTSSKFFLYFLNIVGDIHFKLPGLFLNNPIPETVNRQLWTVPYELQCYAALGGLAVIGVVRNRYLLVPIIVLGQLLWIGEALKHGNVGYWSVATGPVLVLDFLTGIACFLFRDRILLEGKFAILCGVLCTCLLLLPRGAYYVTAPATYLTIYLGLLDPPKIKYLLAGDYSYGLYLYGYPIQQAFASLGQWTHHWYLNAVVCIPTTFVLAYFSWNIIEKRALGFRRELPKIEQRLMVLFLGPEYVVRLRGTLSAREG